MNGRGIRDEMGSDTIVSNFRALDSGFAGLEIGIPTQIREGFRGLGSPKW